MNICGDYNKGVFEMKKKVVAGLMIVAALATVAVTGTTGVRGLVSNASYDVEAALNNEEEEDTLKANANKEEIDAKTASYNAIMEEENYVIELVSSKLNKELTTSDWQTCLEYLEANLESLLNEDGIDKDKVTNYVEAYQIVRNDKAEEATSIEATGVNPGLNNYNVDKVSEYIANYWDYDSYNPEYPDFDEWGGDCANFVSQCLYAGGMQMIGTDASNFNNWFCRTSITEEFSKTSSTWRGAAAFASYWKKNALSYYDFGPEYFENRHAFKEVFKYANVGDAISFITDNGRPYHTTIVAHKNRDGDREIRFAAHTSSHYDNSLYTYAYGGYIEAVRIYKMSTPSAELEASYNYDSYDSDIDNMTFEDDEWLIDWEEYGDEWVDEEWTDDEWVDEEWYADDDSWYDEEIWEDEEFDDDMIYDGEDNIDGYIEGTPYDEYRDGWDGTDEILDTEEEMRGEDIGQNQEVIEQDDDIIQNDQDQTIPKRTFTNWIKNIFKWF